VRRVHAAVQITVKRRGPLARASVRDMTVATDDSRSFLVVAARKRSSSFSL